MMSLANFKNMDPFILLSAVNMQLRDEYSSLDELCATNDIDKNKLTEKLKVAGFEYNSVISCKYAVTWWVFIT